MSCRLSFSILVMSRDGKKFPRRSRFPEFCWLAQIADEKSALSSVRFWTGGVLISESQKSALSSKVTERQGGHLASGAPVGC